MNESEPNAWWNTLRHEGVLISPIVLDDWLPEGPFLVEDRAVDKLRQAYFRFADDQTQLRPFLDALLEDFLGHSKPNWRKEHDIPDRFKHQGKKPNRVLLNAGKEHQPRFLVLIDDERVADESGKPHRLGLHSGRRKHADLLRLMRAADVKLGLLTNGHHVRLVYAGMDHESWAEWSAEAWFQGGDGRTALHGLFTLLGVKTLAPDSDSDTNALLVKVQESRDRQADLSHVMGTQIREAVELLIEELTDSLTPEIRDAVLAPLRKLGRSKDDELQSLYQGAIRCIMRLIVQLYAESRALLPKQERLYYESYSIEGLYQLLKRAASDGREEELRSMRTAWPRLLASWRAIHDGSIHKDLQIQSYGGQLFRPYAANPDDAVLAAIAVLEDPRVHVSDWAIHEVLKKLRVGKYKVGRGKWRKGPVDFSDLRTEYIGMMYEGLLDYDLREARQQDGGIVFLAIGDQPALPLNVLAAQQPDDIKRLIKEQSKKNKGGAESATDEDAEPADDESDKEPDEASSDAELTAEEEDLGTADEQFQAAATKWAIKAVEVGGLFGCTPAKLKKLDVPQREKLLLEGAHKLILKAIPPGGMYLVRWSGTRKGSGTFYTKPGLAVPTTVRTLEPLVYANHEDREHRIVKRPEEILALKVCDPAMGSGSFLVAALRFLASALKESFEKYVIPKVEAGELKATETGETAIGLLTERILRTRHEDHSGERMESALKRAVVEHCIYGVDLNPLAVELGKLSLWIETMDPTLRFTFLDHKIKCGNSLIGAWRHQAHIYPLGAWDRDFGEGPKSARTKRAKILRTKVIIPELKVFLEGWKISDAERKPKQPKFQAITGQQPLFPGRAQQLSLQQPVQQPVHVERVAAQATFNARGSETSWELVREQELASLRQIHVTADPREQEEDYRRLILNSPDHRQQKYLLDKWCAVWYWPILAPESAPLDVEPILGPREFGLATQSEKIVQIVEEIAVRYRFFHWELEFPEVFGGGLFGFDCVIGNPPWETAKPHDNEFFIKFDPGYPLLGKQDGLQRQAELFHATPVVQLDYWNYLEEYRAQTNFVRQAHDLGQSKPPGEKYQERWGALTLPARVQPNGFPSAYALQGAGDVNLYKLFAERALACSRAGGRVGLLLPSGIYSDMGTSELRDYILNHNRWEWVFSFENRRRIFDIHASFKFAAIVIQRGEKTTQVRGRFYEHDVAAWAAPSPPYVAISSLQIRSLSPRSGIIVEVLEKRDLAILERMSSSSRLLGDSVEPRLSVGREYHSTDDSDLIRSIKKWTAEGFVKTTPTSWLDAEGTVAVPVYIGIMVHQFDFAFKAFDTEDSKWEDLEFSAKEISPRALMSEQAFRASEKSSKGVKIVFRDIARATDQRTMLAAIIPPLPTTETLKVVKGELSPQQILRLTAVLNSYAFDFALRFRVGGTHLSSFYLDEAPLPNFLFDEGRLARLTTLAGQLSVHSQIAHDTTFPTFEYVTDPVVRASQIIELNDAVAQLYGLSREDMRWILRPDNPDPRNLWRDYRERLKVLEAAGLQGKWYTLEEAREIRRKAGMAVDF